MSHNAAFQVPYTALELRRANPRAPAIDLLDKAMGSFCATDLPLAKWSDDRALPSSPFGQLLLSAFGCRMTAHEWTTYTGRTVDPQLAAAVLDIWTNLVIDGLIKRYGKPNPHAGLQGRFRAADSVLRSARQT